MSGPWEDYKQGSDSAPWEDYKTESKPTEPLLLLTMKNISFSNVWLRQVYLREK